MVQDFLKPSAIRFTQDSIADHFTDGTKLKDTFTDLVAGRQTLGQIETICCMKYKCLYWVVYGNRRLFLLKILEEGNRLNNVRVNVLDFNPKLFWKKFTTKSSGTWVHCRQNKHLKQDLKRIMQSDNIQYEATDGLTREGGLRSDSSELFDFWRTIHNDEDLERYRQETKEMYGEITNDESSWWWCAIL